MYGAILGDIVGSPYEFDCNNYKGKDFPLFSQRSEFTDDTVMTLAVARALLDTRGQDDITIKAALVREMQRLGRAYPDKGYGARFNQWLYEDDPQPYRSYGNGSAMRVSPAAWLAESIQEALHLAQPIAAFLESTDFEDALRTAVSLGGDSDTLTAITGSIAEAFYGVPENLKQECRKRLTPDLEEILQACENMLLQR